MLLNYKIAWMIGGPKLVENCGLSPTNNYRTLWISNALDKFPAARYLAVKVTFVILDWVVGVDRALRVEAQWTTWFWQAISRRGYTYFANNIWAPAKGPLSFYRRLCRMHAFADK